VLLVTASDVFLGVVSYIIGLCVLVAAWVHLPACLCRVVYGRLVVGGVLGGDTAWLLEHTPDEVALSTLPQALVAVTVQHTWAAQLGLAMSPGLITLCVGAHETPISCTNLSSKCMK
jgi:hypothetical protein